MQPNQVQQFFVHLREQVGRVVVGAEAHTLHAFIAVLVRAHVLLEGVPGTGKTLFARTLSRLLGLDMRRVQCTPDLMPGDILGANIFDFRTQSFNLTKGPIFTEFLLADEINRTPPKTQSALLEAMQEARVTIDGTTYPLSEHFTVVATQNPVEHEGTYPLPEAQLDRFLFKLVVSYPPEDAEVQSVLLHGQTSRAPDLDALGIQPLLTLDQLNQLRQLCADVRVEPTIAQYAVRLTRSTRDHSALEVGLSPRASAMLVAASRAHAAIDGRDFVIPDDLKALFLPIARHRILLTATSEMEDLPVDTVINEILRTVPAPR